MPPEAKQRRTLIWVVGLLCLILISLHLYAAKAMDSLPAPFAIEIDGSPISKPASDTQDQTHASTGAEPAVFELKNKRLQCDGHVLARALAEDRSFAPKKVWWFKADTDTLIHDVVANKDGDSYQLQFAGTRLLAVAVQNIAFCSQSRLIISRRWLNGRKWKCLCGPHGW